MTIFSTIKSWLIATVTIIVAALLVMLKLKSKQLDDAKENIKTEKGNVKALKETINKVEAAAELQEKYNEIDENIIKSKPSDINDRLHSFYRD